MIRRVGLAALLVGAVLLGGCSAPTSSGQGAASRPRLVAQHCADLLVLGARGSTQAADRNLGVGTEVRRTVEQLADRLHRRSSATIRVDAIDYDASQTATLAAYQRHTRAGADDLVSRLQRLRAD